MHAIRDRHIRDSGNTEKAETFDNAINAGRETEESECYRSHNKIAPLSKLTKH